MELVSTGAGVSATLTHGLELAKNNDDKKSVEVGNVRRLYGVLFAAAGSVEPFKVMLARIVFFCF